MSNTLRLVSRRPADLERAAELLREGGTVAFPTETVYGLGANALDAAAVEGIFAAKQRPSWDPLIVHVADESQITPLVEMPEALQARVRALTQAFWPGPLTLLLPRSGMIPASVTAGRGLVGLRVPAHSVALELLRLAGLPLAAPSANLFGHTSPTTAAHVLADLDGRIDAVLDGGPTAVGVESTVLDPAEMIVYRPGAVTQEQIEAVCGVAAAMYVPPEAGSPPHALPSPGVGIRHYAPRAQVVLTEGQPEALEQALRSLGDSHGLGNSHPVGVLLPEGWTLPEDTRTEVFVWGDWKQPGQLAARLFTGLRELDDRGVATILCPLPANAGLGGAIRDRLQKAARKR